MVRVTIGGVEMPAGEPLELGAGAAERHDQRVAAWQAEVERLRADFNAAMEAHITSAGVSDFDSVEGVRRFTYDFAHAACNASHADGREPDALRHQVARVLLESSLPENFERLAYAGEHPLIEVDSVPGGEG